MDDNNNSNVTKKPNAWIDWFLSRKSAKIIDRQYKAKLFRTFDASVEEEVCKEKLLNKGEIAFMFKMNFSLNMVNIIHHCQKLAGIFGWTKSTSGRSKVYKRMPHASSHQTLTN